MSAIKTKKVSTGMVGGLQSSTSLRGSPLTSGGTGGTATNPYGTIEQSAKISRPIPSMTKRIRLSNSQTFIVSLLQLLDATIIGLTGAIVFQIYISSEKAVTSQYALAMVTIVAIFISIARRFSLYDLALLTSWPKNMGRLFVVMTATFLVLMGFVFALKVSNEYSRIWVFSTFLFSTIFIFISRGVFIYFVKKTPVGNFLCRRIAIVGRGKQAELFINRLQETDESWYLIVGVYDEPFTPTEREGFNVPFLGDLKELEEAIRRGEITDIVITIPWTARQKFRHLIESLSEFPVNILLAPDIVGYELATLNQISLIGLPVYQVMKAPISDWNAITKLLEDKILAVLILLVLAPFLVAIAIVIKLDSPGPVIFRQKRHGFNNEVFRIRKFRTMYLNCQPNGKVSQAKKNDLRVTKSGRFLRRTSLDELPQLFDVLMGTMSLVGPRPHAIEHDEKYARVINGYCTRHKVKPGITGWAQVQGWRGETDKLSKMRARIEHDVYYMENWTLWFDFKILVSTLIRGWRSKNAY